MNRNNRIYNINKVSFLISFIFLFTACDRNLEEMDTDAKIDFPDKVIYHAHILHKDSAQIQMDLRSPLIEMYQLVDSPYTLFPKGVDLDFYENNKPKPGYLQANWAKLNDATNLYEGKGNVILVNDEGDSLKTEHLFWNRVEKRVYTTKEVFLISKNGDSLHARNGLEATDNLDRYTLFNNQGFMWVDENEKF